jgi:ABC-type uncharacterized transport system substrate-binding protein
MMRPATPACFTLMKASANSGRPLTGRTIKLTPTALAACSGPSETDASFSWHRAAYFVDKILRGAKPRELPVEQPTRFYLTVNLKTAKALGLDMPPTLLARADEVIE